MAGFIDFTNGRHGTGIVNWSMQSDSEGQRLYTITYRVRALRGDGPASVITTPGLPRIGSPWIWGISGNTIDVDLWAYCTPEMTAEPDPVDTVGRYADNKDNPDLTFRYWKVTQKFSTIPARRCNDVQIEDPLLEPPKVSGSFVTYTKEILRDRNGKAILTSSHEIIRGPQVEFDDGRHTVVIEHNWPILGLADYVSMINTVNAVTLWGMEPRKIKLSSVSWSRNFYGYCHRYYTRTFEFEVDFKGFDKEPLDEGTKALGHWNPVTGAWKVEGNKNNPGDFERYKDRFGENAHVLLNGAGVPLGIDEDPVPIPTAPIEYYKESDFRTLFPLFPTEF
jgi:hypothetical protein